MLSGSNKQRSHRTYGWVKWCAWPIAQGKGLNEGDFPLPLLFSCNYFRLFRASFLFRVCSGLCSNQMPPLSKASLYRAPTGLGSSITQSLLTSLEAEVLISGLPEDLCAITWELCSPSPAQRLCCSCANTLLGYTYRLWPESWAFNTQRRLQPP